MSVFTFLYIDFRSLIHIAVLRVCSFIFHLIFLFNRPPFRLFLSLFSSSLFFGVCVLAWGLSRLFYVDLILFRRRVKLLGKGFKFTTSLPCENI